MSMLHGRHMHKPTAFEVTYPGETQVNIKDSRCQGNRRGADHSVPLDSVRNIFGVY
jgi:hypothetical protein